MAIRTVITRGYGNGIFNGTVPLVTTRGYITAVVAALMAGDDNMGFVPLTDRIGIVNGVSRIGYAPRQNRVGVVDLISRTKVVPIKDRTKTT